MKKGNDDQGKFGKNGGATVNNAWPALLHIDDDPNDTELLRAAARKANLPFILHNVEDADQAIAYLTGKGVYAERNAYPLPSLILLDLKMPRTNGFELLGWLKTQADLCTLPVVVLSGSELKEDIARAYRAGASAYMVKPLGFDALVDLVGSLTAAWIAPQGSSNANKTVFLRTG